MPVTLHFDWMPNPLVYADMYDIMAAGLEDLRIPLEASANVAAYNAARRFDEEGPGWAPWALGFQYPEGGNGSLLNYTGAMEERASSASSYIVAGDTLSYNFDSAKEEAHQYGAGPHGWSKGDIPARPFIGLSPEGENMVEAIFGAWLDTIIVGSGWGGTVSAMPAGITLQPFRNPLTGGPVYRGAGGKFVSGP